LNPAVEAASAAEHGSGFAVFAAEARNLAQRAATAAKEIKELIGESRSRVDEGAKAGRGQCRPYQSHHRGDRRREQRTELGIEKINKAIVDMDGSTQQNAALVEQAAVAATTVNGQARELAQIVRVFRLTPATHGMQPWVAGEAPARRAGRRLENES
jgi:methyl-accepting chemotaxis protein